MKKPLETKSSRKLPKSEHSIDGVYPSADDPSIHLIFSKGRYKFQRRSTVGARGTYTILKQDSLSVTLVLEEPKKIPVKYKLTRSGAIYVFTDLSNDWPTRFMRKDKSVFLADSELKGEGKSVAAPRSSKQRWKQLEATDAAVTFYLTGESLILAAVMAPPDSKQPVVVRITHANVYGPVDSDIYVRLGDPKEPLDVQDFDTVSDWRPAKLVEDLTWSDDARKWKPRGKSKGVGSYWSGTYDVEIQFPKGRRQIELKIISRVPEVCSIVLSNWKVHAK